MTTPAGAWKMLTYPIRVDGSRLTEAYGYAYRYSSLQALVAKEGCYAQPRQPSLQTAGQSIQAF
jgi:hypothetical protein